MKISDKDKKDKDAYKNGKGKMKDSQFKTKLLQDTFDEQAIIKKMRIHTLQKIEEFSGVVEDDTLRPH